MTGPAQKSILLQTKNINARKYENPAKFLFHQYCDYGVSI